MSLRRRLIRLEATQSHGYEPAARVTRRYRTVTRADGEQGRALTLRLVVPAMRRKPRAGRAPSTT